MVNCLVWLHGVTIWFGGLNFCYILSTFSDIIDITDHEYNTKTEKEAVASNEALAKMEEKFISTISCLKEEIINLEDIAIKRLQEENKKLRDSDLN